MEQHENLDIAIYLRKSREDLEDEQRAAQQGKKYDTLAKHRTELLNISKKNNHNIIDIYEEVVSGAYIGERPEIQKLLQGVKNMKYDAVLVMDIDRLGRGDKVDQGRIERAFKESHTLIITPTDVIDMNRDSDEEKMEFKTFIARMEYRQIRKRLMGGRIRAAKSGRDISTKPPYGYRKGRDKVLEIYEEEAKVVRMIYDWCIQGLGRVKSAERLIEMGIPNPSGMPTWSHVTVMKILSNPKYKGDQVFGRVKWNKQEDGTYKTKKVTDPTQLHTRENAHEAIIDEETWNKAQQAVTGRRRAAPLGANIEQVNPFATILRCKKCGHAMLANNPKNRPSIYLYCDSVNKCGQKMIALDKVEDVLLAQLEIILDQLKANTKHRTKRTRETETIVEMAKRRMGKIQEEITRTKKQRANLHDLLEDGTYDKDTFMERLKLNQDKLRDLEIELQEIEQRIAVEAHRHTQAATIIPNIEKALSTYRNAKSAKVKNNILKSFIKEIRYNREKDWKGPYQFEIEIELYE